MADAHCQDSWYMLDVRDAQGNVLQPIQGEADDLRTLHAVLKGTGFLPDRLTVSILIETEGEGAAAAPAAPILLTPDK